MVAATVLVAVLIPDPVPLLSLGTKTSVPVGLTATACGSVLAPMPMGLVTVPAGLITDTLPLPLSATKTSPASAPVGLTATPIGLASVPRLMVLVTALVVGLITDTSLPCPRVTKTSP